MNHVLLYDYDVCQELVVMESDTKKKNHSHNLANEEIQSGNIQTNIPITFFLMFLLYFILNFLIRKKIKERELQKIYIPAVHCRSMIFSRSRSISITSDLFRSLPIPNLDWDRDRILDPRFRGRSGSSIPRSLDPAIHSIQSKLVIFFKGIYQ